VEHGSLDYRLLEYAFQLTAIGALQREESLVIASSERVTVTECAGRQQLRHLSGHAGDGGKIDRTTLLQHEPKL
jgi:hypothetical protein